MFPYHRNMFENYQVVILTWLTERQILKVTLEETVLENVLGFGAP